MTETDRQVPVRHAEALLAALGLYDPHDESTRDTPRRLVRALEEMTAGRHLDPTRHLAVTFPAESPDPGLIAVTGVPFIAVCEHHLLPFTGEATVGYLPAAGARIVGLSKLARLVQEYAARPQVQERLGQLVVAALDTHLQVAAAGCIIRSSHSCMTHRGARATGSAGAWSRTSTINLMPTCLHRPAWTGVANTKPWGCSDILQGRVVLSGCSGRGWTLGRSWVEGPAPVVLFPVDSPMLAVLKYDVSWPAVGPSW